MTLETLPTHRQLLALNRALPDALRDRSVGIEFTKPVPIHLIEHFYRIRLTQQMLAGGEDDFFMPEIAQPHKVGQQLCPTCDYVMRRVSLRLFQCENPWCVDAGGNPSQSRLHDIGPSRGVVSVMTKFDAMLHGRQQNITFHCGSEHRTIGERVLATSIVNGCLLVLDRRYRQEVLAGVYRTAGLLCEELRAGGVAIQVK